MIACMVQLRENTLKNTPMSSREETYTAIRKALAKLDDPFTRFLEPSRYQALKRGNAGGGVTGVGLEVGFDTDSPNIGSLVVCLWMYIPLEIAAAACCASCIAMTGLDAVLHIS